MEGILSGSDERSGQARDSLYVHNGKFMFTRMPFEVKGASVTFQRLMTSNLMELTAMQPHTWTI